MHDLVVRGGTVVDGSGAAPRVADLAVDGDRIVEVGSVAGSGRDEVDAAGLVVTPGFVDHHTHLDAQIAWDPLLSSSCWHGVSTVVLGNCGVTFAPVRPGEAAFLAELMESVEDIPAASILAGLPWDWEGYGGYLDALERMPRALNVGGMVGHCALRHYVMGERGLDQAPATDDDVVALRAAVDEAMAAGALGFSTSRTLLHRVPDGRPVPGTWAEPAELLAIADVLGAHGRGLFEVAPRFEQPGPEFENTAAEVAWMADVNRRTGRPVTFGLAQSDLLPELYERILERVDHEAERGGELRPQTTARGIGLLFGLAHRTFFDRAPGWAELATADLAGRLAALDDPERRERLVAEAEAHTPPLPWDSVFVLDTEPADYAFTPQRSLAARAASAGESIAAAFVRLARESRGRAVCSFPFLNPDLDAVEAMLAHPRVVLGLGDSGAHVGQIMDASLPTWFLAHWVRDRGRFSLAEGVRRLTAEPAALVGLTDRGRLAPGARADVNLVDLDALALPLPEVVHDLPGGAPRWIQRSAGYVRTIVNGRTVTDGGEATGVLPGEVLRAGR